MIVLGVTVAVVVCLLCLGAGGIGDAIAGWLNSEAIKDAARTNAENLRQINNDQIALAKEARGEGGVPTWLPRYTGDYEAGTLFPDAQKAYNAGQRYLGDPTDRINFNQGILNSMRGSVNNANKTVNDLFSGRHTADQIAWNEPVKQNRLAAAGAMRQATNMNIQDRINTLKAQQANRGYVGGSTFDQNAILRGTADLYNQSATADAAARLQNATDDYNIRQSNWQLAFQNPTLPAQMIASDMQLESLPVTQAISDQNALYSVFAPFNLGNWTPPTLQRPFEVKPNTALGDSASKVGDDADAWLNNYWRANQADAASKAQAEENQRQRDWLTQMMNNKNTSASSGSSGGSSGSFLSEEDWSLLGG